MPHKHKRRVREEDVSNFNLPPTTLAEPLPVTKSSRAAKIRTQAKSKNAGTSKIRKSRRTTSDDTPKAFVRLMRYQSAGKRPSGLDDGDSVPNGKKGARMDDLASLQKKRSSQHVESMSGSQHDPKDGSEGALKIQPGERLSEFSARVNQALPISGLNRTAKQLRKEGLGNLVRERQTKREKKIQRMQAEWREIDTKRKEREEEALEEAEEEEAELWSSFGKEDEEGKRLSKKRRRGAAQGVDDPWAELKSRRGQRHGLHDVAQAPPDLRQPKQKLKLKNGAQVDVANVPTSAGSLRRREELGTARKDVIERYRQMMQEKSGQL